MSKARARPKKSGPEPDRAGGQGGHQTVRTESSDAPKRAAEWFERLLPEQEREAANNFSDRQLKRKAVHNANEVFGRAVGAFDAIERAIEDDDTALVQQRADIADRVERRQSDEVAREREEIRKDIRVVVEVEERRRSMRQRDVLLALTVVSVLATIAIAFVTVKHREPWFLGGSLVTSLLSGGGIYLLRSGPWGKGDVGAGTGEPEKATFRWTGLEYRPSADETA
jgi:hypothetical protein